MQNWVTGAPGHVGEGAVAEHYAHEQQRGREPHGGAEAEIPGADAADFGAVGCQRIAVLFNLSEYVLVHIVLLLCLKMSDFCY